MFHTVLRICKFVAFNSANQSEFDDYSTSRARPIILITTWTTSRTYISVTEKSPQVPIVVNANDFRVVTHEQNMLSPTMRSSTFCTARWIEIYAVLDGYYNRRVYRLHPKWLPSLWFTFESRNMPRNNQRRGFFSWLTLPTTEIFL